MSSAVDEDTVRAINSGRETLGAMFSSAQAHLQKVFIVFVAGFMGAFWALRIYIWDFLEETAKAEMSQYVAESTDLITRTPFEVILLQAKIGLLFGIIVSIPALLYFARGKLKERGHDSVVPISRLYLVSFAVSSFVLFWGGIIYAYAIFFPYAFDFLASNAVHTGVKPSFGITEFTEFIALLTLSFGLAAQLPLFMGVLSYTEIVPYETFRDKWRHAIVGVTVFGALFSPPDPFTLIMWAMPMVVLYVFSLGLAKVVANVRRRGAAETPGSGTTHIKRLVLQFVAALVIVALATAAAVSQGAFDYLQTNVYPTLPDYLEPSGGDPAGLESIALEYGLLGEAAVGLIVAASVGFLVLLVYTLKVLQGPVYPREGDIRNADDPEDVDFEMLEADDIEDVPAQVFRSMSEDDALEYSRKAMYDDNREKAEAILNRFDSLEKAEQDPTSGEASATGSDGDSAAGGDEEAGGVISSTAAGMLDPFTEEETTEDDIGGYAYDIAFVFNSLTSKMFRIVGLLMIVMGGSFFWLYQGGLRQVLTAFLDRVPEPVLQEVAVRNGIDPSGMALEELIMQMDIVIALHPVEVLIFNVKVSVLASIIAVLPLVLYYAWPALKERGLVYGDRRIFIVWGGSLLGGFAVGTYLGFFWVAPAVVSYLVSDAVTNGMVVSFRISSFFWLVIFTTAGIGFLFNVVVTMALFHVGGIVRYRTMLRGWRPVVVGIFAVAAVASPKGILTMLLFAIPIALTYMLGLAVLYALTGGGRLFGGKGGGPDLETGLLGR
ncbi:twin-arginine translocase subunit TatC [Natronobacterium gregoryi]|uniref:Sec-independent protein translocase protein TatC n=2 Tax=Natronobacterium gregoryi TaxID=44930 RepID=L0AFL9_NATGS|nr:twin-arginine translocase subunit TatC [Natronobacterium gregoryi]AFZ72698.1 Sec-independent protein secretion pathway component TatC [Natronobacterium gregoryi SP2]ELY69009.1 Sec-independent periplasmic protein translocase [Natronobacterium gregoryi SP2]PLK20649.1 translocase [Natronobacterium gregoryi SP2]SFI91938.1 sec-independent protein translocase protein TatC [Natronobacterium gregoryi]